MIIMEWEIGKLGFRLGQMHNGAKYLGDLIVCNTKLIHVLFLWNNLQGKEMKVPGRQLSIQNLLCKDNQ